MRGRAGLLLLLALTAGGLAGCGKKGPPVAPEQRLPMAPVDLHGTVDGDGIVVSWTKPGARVDGTRLRDVSLLKLYRREESGSGPLKSAMLSSGRVVGYDEIAAIRLDAPGPAGVQGSSVTWVDRRGLAFGRRYVYVATAEDSLGRSSAPSERLAVTFLAAPTAPLNLRASPGDRRVTLTWQPPAELRDGSPVAGELRYVVLRGGTVTAALAPVTAEPVPGTSFTDTGLDNDTDYRYAVRAVRVEASGRATGEASAAVTAAPADRTPPSAPGGLVAVPAAGAVRLAWNPSPEPDVALYAVYRAAVGDDFVRIATTQAVNVVYTDRDVRAGTTYRYAVSALDSARRANESPRSNVVSVTVR